MHPSAARKREQMKRPDRPGAFYLHEDDWAMISIMPAENFDHARTTAAEADKFSREHFDGTAWTEMYFIPEEQYPISTRRILLSEIEEIFISYLTPVDRVATGFSSYKETVSDGFALVGEKYGVFYGSHEDGVITSLYVARFAGEKVDGSEEFIKQVVTLGKRYNLILADWWDNRIVNLQNELEVKRYILSEDVGGEPDRHSPA